MRQRGYPSASFFLLPDTLWTQDRLPVVLQFQDGVFEVPGRDDGACVLTALRSLAPSREGTRFGRRRPRVDLGEQTVEKGSQHGLIARTPFDAAGQHWRAPARLRGSARTQLRHASVRLDAAGRGFRTSSRRSATRSPGIGVSPHPLRCSRNRTTICNVATSCGRTLFLVDAPPACSPTSADRRPGREARTGRPSLPRLPQGH